MGVEMEQLEAWGRFCRAGEPTPHRAGWLGSCPGGNLPETGQDHPVAGRVSPGGRGRGVSSPPTCAWPAAGLGSQEPGRGVGKVLQPPDHLSAVRAEQATEGLREAGAGTWRSDPF